ncbi:MULTISPECIES: glycoside hydrolase family 44 protein [unclassified Paenibacillus]|uniref:glycoside hydrolase family 44 protein n=1 Tax=unclassified Paenibacillus TaxID=185978 RepID=UPI00362A0663
MVKQTIFKRAAVSLKLAMAFALVGSGLAVDLGRLPAAEAAGSPAKLTVYDDKLNSSFSDYSWANHTLSEAKTVHTGSKSIRMKPNNDDGLYLYKDRIVKVSDYPTLELWLNGGKGSAQKLEVVLQAGGQPVASSPINGSLFGTETWQKASIDLSKLNIPGGLFDGILIRGTTSGQQPDVYLDDIVLTNGGITAEKKLTGISLSPAALQLKTGQNSAITAVGAYSDGSNSPLTQGVAWTTSDPAVAQVSSAGQVSAGKAGSAVVTAQSGGFSATASVSVTEDAVVLTGISVVPSRLDLLVGKTGTATATAAYSNGTSAPLTQGVVWSSSDPTVASVVNGTVNGLKVGSSVLSAVYGTAHAEAKVFVTEAAPPPVDDGQAGLNIYEDALSTVFKDNSWAPHNLGDTSVVHTGTKAVSFNPSGNGGFYLYKDSGVLQVKDYDRLEFWINGGESGGQQLELVFNAGGQAGGSVNIGSLLEGGKIPANSWTKVLLQLPELKIKDNIFDGLLFRGMTDGAQGTVYLDDIRLLEKYVAPPTLVEGVLSQYGMVLAPGDNAKLTFEARYSNSTSADVSAKTVWTTSDPDIITVNKGELKAIGNGLAKITAVYGTATASMYVQVVSYTPEAVYTDGLAAGYDNWSWGTQNFDNAKPTASGTKSISFVAKGYEGIWMHRNTKMDLEHVYGLSLKIHGGTTGGQKLRVNLMDNRAFVGELDPELVLPNGIPANQWVEVKLKFADLGVSALTFDGIVVSAWGEKDQGTVYFDDINLLKTTSVVKLPAPELPTVQVTIDSTKGRRTLSPGIFGVNFEDNPSQGHSTMNVPIKRWGGNAMTRYNWEIDTTNRGGDWYFLNIANDNSDPSKLPNGSLSDQFIQNSKNTGTEVLLQVPTIGWTPKDRKTSWSFSIEKYGKQQGNECDWKEAWCRKDAGNGKLKDGTYLTGNNPEDTSKKVSYDFVSRWVEHIKQRFGSYVHNYALDNEPMLWPHSHWDVHPQMTTYDEVWNYTVGYAEAIKKADPQANIFGPVPWGWCEYFYSAKDGCSPGKDMETHDNKPYLEWFLGKVENYRQQTGKRLVDTLDIHYYPAENNVAFSSDESTAMTKRRFNSLKSLYDPNFTDPSSWIQEPVKLIPRMHDIIARNSPGMKLSISEYNFGDGTGIGSGLAQAEALALFAREGVDYAMRWGGLLGDTPLEDAFKLFLNYDGKGSRIEGDVVSASSSNLDAVGAYTIVSAQGKKYVLLFNKDTAPREAKIQSDLPLNAAASVYRFEAQKRLAPAGTVQGTDQGISLTLPAKSATLIVMP